MLIVLVRRRGKQWKRVAGDSLTEQVALGCRRYLLLFHGRVNVFIP